jgi:hypothetical protein
MTKTPLETLLWHPYSATHQGRGEFRLNDDTMSPRGVPVYIAKPPRHQNTIPAHVDIKALVYAWAASREFKPTVANHLIMCQKTRDVLLIDYILETTADIILLSIDYIGDCSEHQQMIAYMKRVKKICANTFKFIPKCYVLQISGPCTPTVNAVQVA